MKILLLSLLSLISSSAFAAFDVVAPTTLEFAQEGSKSIMVRNAGPTVDSLGEISLTGSKAFRLSMSRCSNVAPGRTCLITVTESLRGLNSSTGLSALLSAAKLTSPVGVVSLSTIPQGSPAKFTITRTGSSDDLDVSLLRSVSASFMVKNIGGVAGIPPINFSKEFEFFTADFLVNRCLGSIDPGKTCTLVVKIPPQKLSNITFGIRSSITENPEPNQEASFQIISNQPKYLSLNSGVRTYSDGTLARSCRFYAMSNAPGTVSGIYRIKPHDSLPALNAYCNMDIDSAGESRGYTLAAKFIGGDVPDFHEWQFNRTGTNSSIAIDGSRTFRLSDDLINAIRNINAKKPDSGGYHYSLTVFDKSKSPAIDYSVRFYSLSKELGINIPFSTNNNGIGSAMGPVYINAHPNGGASFYFNMTFTDVNVGVWAGYVLPGQEWNDPYTTVMFPMATSYSCGNESNNQARMGIGGLYSSISGSYVNTRCDNQWPSDPSLYTNMYIR